MIAHGRQLLFGRCPLDPPITPAPSEPKWVEMTTYCARPAHALCVNVPLAHISADASTLSHLIVSDNTGQPAPPQVKACAVLLGLLTHPLDHIPPARKNDAMPVRATFGDAQKRRVEVLLERLS